MDKQEHVQPQIIQKSRSVSNSDEIIKLDHLVKLRTWVDGNEHRAITGTYLLGNNQLNQDIENIVLQMTIGDIWKIKTNNKITGKQEIVCIQTIDVQESNQIHQPKDGRNINGKAQQAKKQGNGFIKQKKYQQAINSYGKAYKLIEYNCNRQAVEIRLSVVSNLALASLNAGKYEECLEWCKKHLAESIQPNKKILFREVSAYKGLKQWNIVKEKINSAIELLKGDEQTIAEFKALKELVEKEQKVETAKEKRMYGNMFG